MNGVLIRDVEFRGPSSLASGTVKMGTKVKFVKKGDWASWVVTHHEDAPFFCDHDWKHRFVSVPADAVKENEVKP